MKLPNGFGSVTKLKGKRRKPFVARLPVQGYDDEGRAIRPVLGYYKKEKEAIEALSAYHDKPYDLIEGKWTFADVYQKLIVPHAEKKSLSLQSTYKAAFQNLSPLHDVIFQELNAKQIERVFKNEKGSASKKDKMLTLISLMYKLANKYEITSRTMPQMIDKGEIDESKARSEFSKEEIDRIKAAEGYLTADILLILLHTGMRISELLEIEKKNVHLEERYMIGGSKTAAGKNRPIPIHEWIVPLIEKYYRNSEKYLIEDNGKNIVYGKYKEMFKRFSQAQNIHHTTHETRHTAASYMKRAEVPEFHRKLVLGHAQSDFTDRHYTHAFISELVDSINMIDICGKRGEHLRAVR